jgi:hypothetical protein
VGAQHCLSAVDAVTGSRSGAAARRAPECGAARRRPLHDGRSSASQSGHSHHLARAPLTHSVYSTRVRLSLAPSSGRRHFRLLLSSEMSSPPYFAFPCRKSDIILLATNLRCRASFCREASAEAMRRRDCVLLLGDAMAARPLTATPESRDCGARLLSITAPSKSHIEVVFRQGLSESGFVEGKNAAIETRWVDDR